LAAFAGRLTPADPIGWFRCRHPNCQASKPPGTRAPNRHCGRIGEAVAAATSSNIPRLGREINRVKSGIPSRCVHAERNRPADDRTSGRRLHHHLDAPSSLPLDCSHPRAVSASGNQRRGDAARIHCPFGHPVVHNRHVLRYQRMPILPARTPSTMTVSPHRPSPAVSLCPKSKKDRRDDGPQNLKSTSRFSLVHGPNRNPHNPHWSMGQAAVLTRRYPQTFQSSHSRKPLSAALTQPRSQTASDIPVLTRPGRPGSALPLCPAAKPAASADTRR
jgi:hypothetical protein